MLFNQITLSPPDPIFGLMAEFVADTRPHKIPLNMGVYRNEALQTPILEAVKMAEAYLLETERSKEYLPISGDPLYIAELGSLIFGETFWQSEAKRVCGVQTIGGTGALRMGGDFLKEGVSERIVISDPTWPNHKPLFTQSGLVVETYPYYACKKIDFTACYEFLQRLPTGSCVLLHPCCHNPTGLDFSLEQWKSLMELFEQKGLLAFFDFAYQGFGVSLAEDAAVVRLFAKEKMEMIVAYSCAKNFGLYSERAGALFILAQNQKSAEAIASKIKVIIRTNYSNPPRHSSSIVAHILSTPILRKKWEEEVEIMQRRIANLRAQFVKALAPLYEGDLRFISEGKGMFCLTGLTPQMVDLVKKEFGIYMTSDGRMNIASLSDQDLKYVAEKIISITSSKR